LLLDGSLRLCGSRFNAGSWAGVEAGIQQLVDAALMIFRAFEHADRFSRFREQLGAWMLVEVPQHSGPRARGPF
jgi:hypothetical protein